MSGCRFRGYESDPFQVFFVDTDHKMISVSIPILSSDSRWVVVSYKRKYVHKVMVNHLVKLAQEKMRLGELTIPT